jgi:hypothetical protein
MLLYSKKKFICNMIKKAKARVPRKQCHAFEKTKEYSASFFFYPWIFDS